MKFRSKRYRKALENIDLKREYILMDAIEILRANSFERSKSIELSFSLNWNSKQNNLRGYTIIPFPAKKEKIAVIDENIPEDLKKNKNIIFISLEELPNIITKKKSNWDFKKIFADYSVSGKLKPFAKALASKKSFPNSKDGTLSNDLIKSIAEWESGKIELVSDKGGNFHVLLGNIDLGNEEINENYNAIIKKIISLKPSNWKGDYLKRITLSSSMGPGIRVLM